jgi:hypothetical protein
MTFREILTVDCENQIETNNWASSRWADCKGTCKMQQCYLRADMFVDCNWVATRWQLYSTHLHTNSTQNDTKQTIHRTTQK